MKRPPEAKAEPVKEPARAITTMTAAELLQSDLPPRADADGGGVLPKGGLALLAAIQKRQDDPGLAGGP